MTQSSHVDQLSLIKEAEKCRDSLKLFVSKAWSNVDPSPFVDGWCIDAICDHLTALTTGQIRFLLINIPPRHSKSTICSVLWPVWSWLHKSEDKFLCASYNLNLAIRDNLKKRNLIDSKWFQERYGQTFKLATDAQMIKFLRDREFTLSHYQNTKRFFLNDKLGYQLAVSVGATGTTGEGGSVLLIDDPHSATDAHSDVERESAVTWFREVWSNRMNDANKDSMLVIGQRIHENDVSGIILKERPDWIHLNLPAEYEPLRHCFTSIGWSDKRKIEGELLWEERFSKETLERYKRDLGPFGYAAQYQQSPTPTTGGIFDQRNERVFEENHDTYFLHTPLGIKPVRKSDCEIFMTVDPAISEKQSADYTVIGTWAKTPLRDLLLLNVRRGHWGHAEQQDEIEEEFNESEAEYVAVETVAYQSALFQDLMMKGIACLPFTPKSDKVTRSTGASIWHRNGKMYLPVEAHWKEVYQKELYKFPRAPKDDQVDMTSLAGIAVRSRGPLSDDVTDDEIPQAAESTGGLIPLTAPLKSSDEFTLEVAKEILRQSEKPIDPFEWADRHDYGGDW
jgi:predicted phage terminase large subunit-like protein